MLCNSPCSRVMYPSGKRDRGGDVEIGFGTRKLQKLCSSMKDMKRELGPDRARRLAQRLAELEAADSLADIRSLPGVRCHELKADRSGQLAVDLGQPARLVFEPAQNPPPTKRGGGLDWGSVDRIVVLEIVDYH